MVPVLTIPSGKVCDHEGPCHKPTRGECHCYKRKVHCSRNCPCTQNCKSCFRLLHSPPLRITLQVFFDGMFVCVDGLVLIVHRKGCKCVWKRPGTKSAPCNVGKCECRAAYRECDPEVCGSCHARYANFLGLLEYLNMKNPSAKL